jgi:hypothetical protein
MKRLLFPFDVERAGAGGVQVCRSSKKWLCKPLTGRTFGEAIALRNVVPKERLPKVDRHFTLNGKEDVNSLSDAVRKAETKSHVSDRL